jgi:hypothetical protein
MHRHIAVAAIVAFAVAGCSGGGGGDFQVTTFQNGVSKGTTSVQSMACEKTDFTASVKDGKLTWSTTVKNGTDKRTYACGLLTIVTDANATVYVDFGSTVDNGKEVKLGETSAVIDGMPNAWNILHSNMIIVPGAGCETPTTHVAANWPETAFFAKHRVEKFAPVVEKDIKPLTCRIDKLLSETTDNKLVKVSFDLVNEASVEVTYKIEVTATTDDGRVDRRPFEYSLKAGERKEGVKATLGFAKEFKSVETHINVDGKEKAKKIVKK